MLSKKKQTNLKAGSSGPSGLQPVPAYASSPSTNGQSITMLGQNSKSVRRIAGSGSSSKAGNDLGPSTPVSVAQIEKGFSNVKVKGGASRPSPVPAPSADEVKKQLELQLLDGMITNIGNVITNENERQRQRELKRLMTSLSDWDSIDDQSLIKLIKELQNSIDSIDEKFSPLIQQILLGNWYSRSAKVVTHVERFLSELLVLRPGFAGVAIHSFVTKFCPYSATGLGDSISSFEKKVFAICHQNLERIFSSFPMKQESGVKAMGHIYPYMTKGSHLHYCYVHNLFQSMEYLGSVKGQLLNVIIHKLVGIDVNIPRQDILDFSENQTNNSFQLKKEDGGHEIFQMDMEDEPGSFTENPLIETLDLCLNMVFQYVDSVFKPSELITTREENSGAEQCELFNSLLSIFQAELLPTFGVNNVQFLYFYLLSLQPSFLSNFLEFLWKKATNVNSPSVIRIQTMAYLSGILARGQFISVKTVKRWMTKMSEWANAYASQKSKACHWSSVNVQAHGPFYAVCQTIFYVFAFRNKELITSRKCPAFTRALDLGRLVTSELNPLKACEEQIGITFVEAAHQHQISYCRTVLERNQVATIPTVAQEMVSSPATGEALPFASTQLDAFFPFDPILLPRCKKWMEGIHKNYEPYYEELKVEKDEVDQGETEDSIEMELGSYNNSLKSRDWYCNGVIPYKFKSERRRRVSETDVDLDFID